MLIKVLSIFTLFISALITYAAFKEPRQEIVREITIKATPEKLFPYLNNSQKMNDWMPWQDSDPSAKMNYSGPAEGVGSKSSWNSAGKMGTGDAVIIESIPNQSVKTQLTYTKPMNMSQIALMTLTPSNGETLVRWSVNGHNSFIFRMVGAFCSMDKIVGGEFEKGLLKLKKAAEGVN